MVTTRTMIIVILICLSLILSSFAAEKIESSYQHCSIAIPQHGKLLLTVPSTWKQSDDEPVGIFPTFSFSPDKGDAFAVLITPLWSPENDPTFNTTEKVRTLIDNDLRSMLPRAVEKQANVQELNGVYGKGYYFLLTDKAPKPGEYPYAVRAYIGVGDLLLSVTILSRSQNSEGIISTIRALQEARQSYEIVFNGSAIVNHPTGLTIISDKKDDIIAVTNYKYHYGMILPYSNDWVFTTDERVHLRGNSGKKNVSLWIEEYHESPATYIIRHQEKLKEPGRTPGLIDSKIIPYHDSSILKNVIDLGKAIEIYSGNYQQKDREKMLEVFSGNYQLNYFIAKKWNSILYCMHYSDILNEEEIKDFNEELIFSFLYAGFHVDFKR